MKPTPLPEDETVTLEQLDVLVFYETLNVRNMYYEACGRLHQKPRQLTPVCLGMRSVPE